MCQDLGQDRFILLIPVLGTTGRSFRVCFDYIVIQCDMFDAVINDPVSLDGRSDGMSQVSAVC